MRLAFYIARLRGDEDFLERFSLPKADVFGSLMGKSVAVVGNARALANCPAGPDIDAADIVVRLNNSPMPSPESHGSRTDWIATSIPLKPRVVAERAPSRILWMTHVRKRLPYRLASDPRFYLNRRADWERLRGRLARPPTTGLMVVDLLAASPAREVRLFGFDFFASKSLSGRRDASQVPHDFASERAYVEDLIARDERFRLMPMQAAD